VLAQSDVNVTPFTVQQQTTSYADGEAVGVIEQRLVARSRDGSQAMQASFPTHPDHSGLRRIDLADGRVAMLSDALSTKSSGIRDEGELIARKEDLRNPPADCLYGSEVLIGREQIKGLETSIIVREVGDRRITQWRSPQLQCFVLQTRVEKNVPGSGWILLAEKVPVLVSIGDPSPVFFDTGSSYKEEPPSSLMKKLYASVGATASTCPKCFSAQQAAKMDEAYHSSQR
jgi:hypothetical protein